MSIEHKTYTDTSIETLVLKVEKLRSRKSGTFKKSLKWDFKGVLKVTHSRSLKNGTFNES